MTLNNRNRVGENTLHSNKRLVRNTAYLYIRMLVLMAIAIYTSRIVLQALGDVDFGIYAVVGGIVSMVGFLNNSMANAVQRFLSYEMGRGTKESVSDIFSLSLIGHLMVICVVFVIAEPLGWWLVNHKLVIPASQLPAANWVLQTSIGVALISFLTVPYNAIILAREKMGIYAYISLIEGSLRLAIAFAILAAPAGRLKLYALMQLGVSVIVFGVYYWYCRRKVPESKFRWIKDWKKFKEILSFVSFNLIGEVAQVFTGQGLSIVLNLFFGPTVNTARGLADQVNVNVSKFVNNFQQALTPQVVKTYAAGEVETTFRITVQGINFSYYLLFMITLPLYLQIDTVLGLWLGEVPPYTAVFCRIVLIASLVGVCTGLLSQVVRANGNIKAYQIVCSLGGLLSLPAAWLVLKATRSAYLAMSLLIAVQVLLFGARLVMTSRLTGLSKRMFLADSTWPIFKVTVVSAIAPVALSLAMPCNPGALFAVTGVSIVSVGMCALFIGMDKTQRDKVLVMVRSKLGHRA